MLSDSTPLSLFRQDDCYFTLPPLCHQNNHNNNDQTPLLHLSTSDSPPQSPGSSEVVYSPPTPTSPVTNPANPLLAARLPEALAMPSPPPSSSSTTSLLQRQTAAAHSSHQMSSRPRPYPVQNVLHVTSDDSGSASSSSSDSPSSSSSASHSNHGSSHFSSRHSHSSSLDGARCSRCQRTPSIDLRTGKSNMVSYGLNLWYCSRCANLVGLNR